MPFIKFPRYAVVLSIAACGQAVIAAPLLLSQAPPTLPREPAPNIIVSVDNSTSMGSTGVAELRTALKATFAASNLPDNQIRLAWQSMHGCNTLPGSNTSTTGICRGYNGMRRLAGAHRTNFFNWVDSIAIVRGTPSHFMMDNAGQYLSATGLGLNSPWAAHPGMEEQPVLSCRRSYHILMTDGEYGHSWASGERDTSGPPGTRIVRGGNADGTDTVLPDGTLYSVAPTNTQTRLYRDTWGSSTLSTLSDLAFYYWSRDLQPGIPNNLKPMPAEQFPKQNFGTTSTPAELERYWNPRNNPATWQHMVTYTIGFKSAAQWSTNSSYPAWMGDTFSGLGLAPPRLVDLNANGTIDIAYAGDLKGQLWKFDLSSKNDSDWGVSAWDGAAQPCKDSTACQPLFVARDAASTTQPITTTPLIMAHPMGGIQVMFGTGQNMQPSDPANAAVQTIYSVWDKSTFITITEGPDKDAKLLKLTNAHTIDTGRAALVQQSITTAVTLTEEDGDEVDTIYSNSTDHTIAYSRTDNTAKRGWFMDLPLSGERVLNPPSTFQGQRVIIPSTAPSPTAGGESCNPISAAGQARMTVLNMITGRPSSSPVFFSSDASMDMKNASSVLVESDEFVGIEGIHDVDLFRINGQGYNSSGELGTSVTNGPDSLQECAGNGCIPRGKLRLGQSRGARADWREVR
jgi:Tfp pilus tip-associated adhesin PilY1